jgi:hypothetical protein
MTEVLKKLLTEPFNQFDLKSNFISFEEALYNLNKNYFLNKDYRELNGVYQLVNFENDKTNSIKNFIEQAYPNRFVDVELFLSLFNDADGLGTHKDVEMDNILQVHQGSVQVNIIHDKVYSVNIKHL